ncbi:MAG TPA: cobalt chelatase [Caldimonas sp.]|nr:cobalt chelatase [Caldimonas sp.]HEX2542740.1 cobalt chelatase [Caldimonas sp.]
MTPPAPGSITTASAGENDSSVQARARRQQHIEELCAASIRAIAGEADLHFRGRRLHRGRRALPLYAAHLHPDPDRDDFASFRGAADGLALRLALSDPALHAELAPAHAVERSLFDLLEQYRVEALVPESMPGARRNLRRRHDDWSLGYHHAGLTDTARGLLVYAVAQICRARVTGDPVLEETEDLLEATRAALAPSIGHALAGLRRDHHDQRAYAAHAMAIVERIAAMLLAEGAEPGADKDDADSELEAARSVFGLVLEHEGDANERFAIAVSGASRVLGEAAGGYRVYTRAYDREHAALALARRAVLDEYRERLDRRIAERGLNVAKLARELRALLAVPTVDGRDGAQEEGRIDGRRLAQLVASPTERRLFCTDRVEPIADGALTFLVDCSGSMKAHIEDVAVLLDVFARALEQAGAAGEVLGFTTEAWNGGRAQRDWIRAGRPAAPGRLNERSHIVFKPFDVGWRRARPDMAALLKADLFREGIDGEAVDWACGRLLRRTEARRILIVVSDGSPMDSATALANDPHYLDQHLREVVQAHEENGELEICGVGVGLDLSPYYRRSVVLDLGAAGGYATFREILEMLAGRHRR